MSRSEQSGTRTREKLCLPEKRNANERFTLPDAANVLTADKKIRHERHSPGTLRARRRSFFQQLALRTPDREALPLEMRNQIQFGW